MARSFLSTVVRISREMERAERARIRGLERQQRATQTEARRIDRFERNAYVASREAETQFENQRIDFQIEALKKILTSRIGQDPSIDFKSLFKVVDERELDKDEQLRLPEKPILIAPKQPSFFIRWLPGIMRSYRRKIHETNTMFEFARTRYNAILRRRSEALSLIKREVDELNNSVVEFARNYSAGEPDAVSAYFELVLARSKYPDAFPLERKVAYVKESAQLIIEFELPTFADAVPATEKFRYIKKSDEIAEVKRNEKLRHTIYSNVIAQAVLSCLYDIFRADKQTVVETVVLNAHVSTIDPATGHMIHPCLVSIRTSRDRFQNLELRHVDPVSCLREMRAAVSSHPGELVAVKPILEFNMVDPRFVQESDILSTLDQRLNLMELSPSEFESLITNLFEQMGLDTKLTQPSRDGGVDCIAFDSRPVLGGKSSSKRSDTKTPWELAQFAICLERSTMRARPKGYS
jgi:restriction system protein